MPRKKKIMPDEL
jgi:hypothetical protein